MNMIRSVIYIIVLCIFHLPVIAQSKAERNELMKLVDERQELFGQYSESIKKKSGIFGQKTKNDLRATHDKLKAIVEVDNKIMSRLRQLLDYTRFEKQTMSYDVNDYQEQLKNLENNHTTLLNQLAELEKQNTELKKATSGFGRWMYFLYGILATALFIVLRRKFR